jgi:chromosome segregation ATPase
VFGKPSKEECEQLRKTEAQKRGEYGKAQADFTNADRRYEAARKYEQSLAKSIENVADNVAVWQDIANDAGTALAACQQQTPAQACTKEKSDKQNADAKVTHWQKRKDELEFDYAAAQSDREQREEQLAAAHQAANAAKQALDAAIAAAAECHIYS